MCDLHSACHRQKCGEVEGGKANLFDPHTSSLSPSSSPLSRVFVGAAIWPEHGAAVLGAASLCMVPPTYCWFATAAAAAATEVATTTPLMSPVEDFGRRE